MKKIIFAFAVLLSIMEQRASAHLPSLNAK